MKKKTGLIVAFVVWIIGLPVAMFLFNFLFSLVIGPIIIEPQSELLRYAQKAEVILYPESAESLATTSSDVSKISGYSTLRCLLDNNEYETVVGPIKYHFSQYVAFKTSNGEALLEKGSYLPVVEGMNAHPISAAIGVLSINDMVSQGYADELRDVVEQNMGAYIMLDKYAIKDTLISPITISVVDANGNKIATIEAASIPNGFDIVEADDAYVYVDYYYENTPTDGFEDYNIISQIDRAKNASNLKVNKIGDGYFSNIDFSAGDSEFTNKIKGIGKISYEAVKVSGDGAMVIVDELTYPYTLCIGTLALFACWTIIVVVVTIIITINVKKRKANEA